jgi:hypothetical protein
MGRLFGYLVVLGLVAACGETGESAAGSGTGADGSGADGSGASGSGASSGSGGTSGGGSNAGGSSASAGSSAAAGTTGGGAAGGCVETTCQGHLYLCGDCLDNDGDNLIDSADPDCLGPCDNTEDSYYGGIPGQNNAPCKMDCYFDQDTGPGNDKCYWSHGCDPLSVAPDYPPSGDPGCAYDEGFNIPGSGMSCDEAYVEQSDLCETYCGPLTPNGCDCFGCCELPADSDKYVYLGSTDESGVGTCDLDNVDDPSKCHPCTPVEACWNDCGRCELCLGKTTVPDDCFPGTGGSGGSGSGGSAGSGGNGGTGDQQCDEGVQPCGLPGQDDCPAGEYCITGCCRSVIK